MHAPTTPDAPQPPAPAVPDLHLSSDAFPDPATAFGVWRQLIGAIFTVSLPDDATTPPYAFTLHAWHLGGILVGDIQAGAQHFRRETLTIARGGLDHYLVQLYTDGGYTGDADGHPMQVTAGDISVLDLARPMHSAASRFANITLLVPRVLLAPMLRDPDHVHGLVVPGATGAGMILGDHLRSLCARLPAVAQDHGRPLVAGTVALIAGIVGATPLARDPAAQAIRAALLVRIRRYIDQHLASPTLGPATLCHAFGLSRSSLHRLFESSGGFTRYVQERRLRRCFADIVSPDGGRIADIGYRWGFTNESSFSRAFRRMFDTSPRDARQAALTHRSTPVALITRGTTSSNPLSDWIFGLTGD